MHGMYRERAATAYPDYPVILSKNSCQENESWAL